MPVSAGAASPMPSGDWRPGRTVLPGTAVRLAPAAVSTLRRREPSSSSSRSRRRSRRPPGSDGGSGRSAAGRPAASGPAAARDRRPRAARRPRGARDRGRARLGLLGRLVPGQEHARRVHVVHGRRAADRAELRGLAAGATRTALGSPKLTLAKLQTKLERWSQAAAGRTTTGAQRCGRPRRSRPRTSRCLRRSSCGRSGSPSLGEHPRRSRARSPATRSRTVWRSRPSS